MPNKFQSTQEHGIALHGMLLWNQCWLGQCFATSREMCDSRSVPLILPSRSCIPAFVFWAIKCSGKVELLIRKSDFPLSCCSCSVIRNYNPGSEFPRKRLVAGWEERPLRVTGECDCWAIFNAWVCRRWKLKHTPCCRCDPAFLCVSWWNRRKVCSHRCLCDRSLIRFWRPSRSGSMEEILLLAACHS